MTRPTTATRLIGAPPPVSPSKPKKLRVSTFCATLLAINLAGCSAGGQDPLLTNSIAPADTGAAYNPAKPITKGPAKVALLLPVSGMGPTAVLAKGLKQAAELALFDYDRPTIELMVKDDKGTPEGAIAAAEEALADGAEIILGPLFATSVKAITPLAKRANVPIVAFSSDATVAGPGVYLMSFQVHQEVDRVVGYAANQGRKRFAALVADDAYGKLTEQSFRAAVARVGGTVAALQVYPAPGSSGASNGMVQPAQRLVDALNLAADVGQPVDAVFLPGGPDVLAGLGPLMLSAGLDTTKIKLLGTGGWDNSGIGRDATFVGGWYPAPDPSGWRAFSERFTKTFGNQPPRIATLAHDAVGVAIALSTNAPGQRYTVGTLTRPSGFAGADGAVRFLATGNTERSLAVLEVQKFGVSVVDGAGGGTGVAASGAPTVTAQVQSGSPSPAGGPGQAMAGQTMAGPIASPARHQDTN
jgi:branched-chain amino acid transport system substrate-binding protein